MGSSPTAPTSIMGTYQRFPVTLVRGKGCWVWDDSGKRYLDAVAGIATCSLGHSDKVLRDSLSKQLNKIQHISNLYKIQEQEELANWLVANSCADSVFFCNSGAEANEAAIKLARKYGNTKLNLNESIILSAKGSFHGRTLAAVSATGQPNYHKGFEPIVKGFKYFPYNNSDAFEALLLEIKSSRETVSAVLIEPLQGEGGVYPGELNFFKSLRNLCTKEKILLIFDEVQTGMGRTGTLWGYEQLGIEPDAFTVAKGLGGGHAIGALLVKNHANIFKPGDHASTFGGNPFACKAGLTVCKEIVKRNLLSNVQQRGHQLSEGLIELISKFPKELKEVRGLGLIQGLVLNQDTKISSKLIAETALQQKLLVVPAGANVIRIIPPLIIKKNEVNELLSRLESTLKLLFT
ncbi:aspartate aminotransferase family protein [Prochlorococcus sp. MIT 1300]|uniref:aspartate aminotransferase family protein n=1 Tax=Prochlorococcus sp. MIT 1300 TaxID=3096218 RepID=UPI0039BF3235